MAAAVAVSIARASLRGGLLRPDPTAVAADEIAAFHALLDKALTICSPANIQNCKRWALQTIVPSRARTTLLAKYLVALAPSLAATKPSPRRQRLHILYLINDILHSTHPDRAFADEIQPFLRDLFASAASPGAPKQLAKLEHLLTLWSDRAYYPPPTITELLTATRNAASGVTTPAPPTKPTTGRPLLLPPFHGDPSLPFYDLPAANMLPHLIPNTATPINPRLVKPIQFSTLTPTETLAAAVRDFLASDATTTTTPDSDPDAVGGASNESYFGWTRSFCEKMKTKKRDEKTSSSSPRHRSYSPSSASDYSRSPRRRYRTRSRSRTPADRSRSRSPARPPAFQPQQQQYPQEQHYPQGFPPPPPPPPPPYGYPQYPWPPPPPPPPPGFHAMMQQQGFVGYGYAGYGQAQGQQQQQQQWGQQGAGGGYPPQYAQGPQGGQEAGTGTGFDDYRSVKGREIGAKRGWKT